MVKLKAPRISRRRSARQRETIARHARHIGEIMIEWNSLHASLFTLFWVLIDRHRYELAHGLWHRIQSDKTQREMVLAAAEGTLKEPGQKVMLDRIKWLLARASDLSPYRNDPAHTAINFLMDPLHPELKLSLVYDPVSTRTQALERLTNQPALAYWERARGDLWVLSQYANSIWTSLLDIGQGQPWPFPQRPRLLAVPKKSGRARPKSRPRRAKGLQPPPKP